MRMLTNGTLAPLAARRSLRPLPRSSAARRRRPTPGVPLYARLAGGSGSGNVTVVVDPPKGTACDIMNVTRLSEVTAAHIHTGGPGETGAPVVTLHRADRRHQRRRRPGRPRGLGGAARQPRRLLRQRPHPRLPERRDPRPAQQATRSISPACRRGGSISVTPATSRRVPGQPAAGAR